MRTCIVGNGYIAEATNKLLGTVDLVIPDVINNIDFSRVRNTNIVFVCYEADQDTKAKQLVKRLSDSRYRGTICVRTATCVNEYQTVLMPEFLDRSRYLETEPMLLIGGTYKNTRVITKYLDSKSIKYTLTTWNHAYNVKKVFDLYSEFESKIWNHVVDSTPNASDIYRTLDSLKIPRYFNRFDTEDILPDLNI